MLRTSELYRVNARPFSRTRFGPRSRNSQCPKLFAGRRELLLGGIGTCCCTSCKPKTGWYDKFFAGVMATGMESYEEAVRPFKDNLLQNVRTKGYQKVLEIGIGAAPNLQYLVQDGSSREGLEVIGVDPNPFMFEYARQKADSFNLGEKAFDLQIGAAEEIPLPDKSVDTIICTLVLCSVSDVNASVKEMRRVLKPEGKVYFLEHIFASEDKKLIQFGQKILNPVQQLLADGCHLTRNPLKAFQMAGFENLQTQTFQVPGLGVLSPHISGIATA